MNVVQAEVMFREELRIGVTIKPPAEGCLDISWPDLGVGPVHVYWKYEPRAKKEVSQMPALSRPINQKYGRIEEPGLKSHWQLTAWGHRVPLKRPLPSDSYITFEAICVGGLTDLAFTLVMWSRPGDRGLAICEGLIDWLIVNYY